MPPEIFAFVYFDEQSMFLSPSTDKDGVILSFSDFTSYSVVAFFFCHGRGVARGSVQSCYRGETFIGICGNYELD